MQKDLTEVKIFVKVLDWLLFLKHLVSEKLLLGLE